MLVVITLLAHGCPSQAIAAAFGFDERTINRWWHRAGQHCQQVHQHLVLPSQLNLQQVQADEIKVKVRGEDDLDGAGLDGANPTVAGWSDQSLSRPGLIQSLVHQIRQVALCRPLLVAVDGLPSYARAFQRAFHSKVPRLGRTGRCQLHPKTEVAIVQVVKRRTADTLTIQCRIVQGCAASVERLIQTSQGGGSINTAFIERLNATFRQRLACLTRRSRPLARQPETLQTGMYVLGCVSNFCTYHRSLRIALALPKGRRGWLKCTPAIATGLTAHHGTIAELFWFKVPPPSWKPPEHRVRPSKQTLQLIQHWCQSPRLNVQLPLNTSYDNLSRIFTEI